MIRLLLNKVFPLYMCTVTQKQCYQAMLKNNPLNNLAGYLILLAKMCQEGEKKREREREGGGNIPCH